MARHRPARCAKQAQTRPGGGVGAGGI